MYISYLLNTRLLVMFRSFPTDADKTHNMTSLILFGKYITFFQSSGLDKATNNRPQVISCAMKAIPWHSTPHSHPQSLELLQWDSMAHFEGIVKIITSNEVR